MFTLREYSSDETYDLGKFMDFKVDVYDVINCPFLYELKKLPTVGYYYINKVFEGIDQISYNAYGDPYLWYYIQYYNDRFEEVFYQDERLNLFSLEDLSNIYYNLSNGVISAQ